MFKSLTALIILFISSTAIAADATLSWTPPTTNEDGSTLTDLAGYKFYYGTVSTVYDQGPVTVNDPTISAYTISGLANDTTYYFVATAFNTSGVESVYSNEAAVTTPPLAPSAPLNLTVTAENLTAYTYSISDDVLRLIAVGTVPADTPCDGTMSINGYHRVDRDLVDYAGSARPPIVFALCS